MPKHNWTTVSAPSTIPIWVCVNCQGIKIKNYNGQFTYFYQARTNHC